MGTPTNTLQTYDLEGLLEELSDVIYNKDPEETPLFTALSKGSCRNTYVEWQRDTLRDAVTTNAHAEGADVSIESRTPTTRLGNYTQIFLNSVGVSGTESAVNKAGRATELAYQLLKIGKEQRLDIEKTLFANQAQDNGNDDGIRRMSTLGSWIFTNTDAGSGGSDPTGDGTDTRTDGTQEAFDQDRFDAVMRSIYDNSGNTKQKRVFLNSWQMSQALGFTGNNNQRTQVSPKRVSNDMVAYMTPFGEVMFQLSNECRPRDVYVLDMSMFEIKQLRPMRTESLGRSGDNLKRYIVTELTFCCKNDKTSGLVADNTTS